MVISPMLLNTPVVRLGESNTMTIHAVWLTQRKADFMVISPMQNHGNISHASIHAGSPPWRALKHTRNTRSHCSQKQLRQRCLAAFGGFTASIVQKALIIELYTRIVLRPWWFDVAKKVVQAGSEEH